MNRQVKVKVTTFLTLTLVIVVPAFPQIPDGVSPGAADRTAEIEGRCPTFTWSPVPGAAFHELVGYRLSENSDLANPSEIDLANADQILYAEVPGTASAWAPELAECLTPGGNYVWFVRAVYREEEGEVVEASEWSYGRYFSISSMPSAGEVEEALRVLRRYAEHTVDPEGLETERADTKRPAPSRRVAVPQQVPKSVTTAKTAIKGSVSDVIGETYGVVGISNSPDGAGVAAANTNGGADLVIDGSEDGQPDAVFTQAGIDRASPSEQWFSLINSDAGVLSLNVEGTIVGDGSGLTAVDADTLDGTESSDFATDVEAAGLVAVHGVSADHDGRYYTETELSTSSAGGTVHWDNLSAVPAGFADGVDDVAAYTVGDGIILNGGQIRLDPAAFVPRVAIVDSTGDVGRYSSIAVGVDGFPLISYYDATNENLKVAHCEDDGCTSATITVLDSVGTNSTSSVAIGSDGLGLIGYIDQISYELKVAHCSDVACTGATITTLDASGNGMGSPSVAIGVDGLGLISYNRGSGSRDLMVAHCANTDCTSSNLSVLDSSMMAFYSSLTIGGDGLGLISYYDATNDNVKIAHCTDPICTNASTITLAPASIFTCTTSIATGADGFGLISYPFDELGELRVAHCVDAACSSAVISIIRGSGSTGSDSTSIAVDLSGFGLIAYSDFAGSGIGVARCTNADCTPAASTNIDTVGSLGSQRSIAVGLDGRAWISYQDWSNKALRVIHLPYGF